MGRRYEHDRDYTQLINSQRWRRLRAWQLTKQPICERCEAAGLMTPATEVHHRQPVERAGSLEAKTQRCYDAGNIMSLCHACHEAVHAELMSHDPKSIAATAAAETEEMKRALFDGGGNF